MRWLLKRLHIYPNAYYNYLRQRKVGYREQKEKAQKAITRIYHEMGGILGHRSMRVFLAREGIKLSKTTVHKYMNKQLQLYSICRRRRPGYQKGKASKVFPNYLNRHFIAPAKNKVWCTDFTYIFLSNGTLRFNCTVIDLYDRSVVASENGRWITSDLAIRALEKALRGQPSVPKDLILHSDQGTQFSSTQFMDFCHAHGIRQSMSRAGCPYDNAPMERYYNTLKAELLNLYRFNTAAELDRAIAEYAYGWYNQVRPHAFNDYATPFEVRFLHK